MRIEGVAPLRPGVLREELKRLFLDPKTFDGLEPSPKEHRETWAHLAKEWDQAADANGFTTWHKGDVFIVLPRWDSCVFVHEAYHAAQAMLRYVATNDEELGAYLVEWLFEEIICRDGRPAGRKRGERK